MQYKTGLGNLLTSFTQSMIDDNPNVMWVGDDANSQLTDIYDVTNITSLPSGFSFQQGTGPTGHQTFGLDGNSDATGIIDTTYGKWDGNGFGLEMLVKFDATPLNATSFLVSKNSYFATSVTDFPFALQVNPSANTITALFSIGDDFSYDYQVQLTNFSSTGWNHVAVMYRDSTNIIELVCNGVVDSTTITTAVPIAHRQSRNFHIGGPALGNAGGADNAFVDNCRFSHVAFYNDFGAQPTANVQARYAMLP